MPAPALMLRPVRDADRAFLLRLYEETRADLAALPLPAPALRQMLDMQCAAQMAGHAAQHPDARHDIVTRDGADIGQIRVDRQAGALHLVDLSLRSAVRGQGIGTRLLRDLQAEAAARGVPLRLNVLPDNPAAGLYARLGFVAADGMSGQMSGQTAGPHLAMEWRPRSR